MENFYESLKNLSKGNVFKNEPMKKHTTFKIGGEADYLIQPADIEDVKNVMQFAKEKNIPCHIIGNGSNLLIPDDGVKGIVIENKMDDIQVDGDIVIAKSGVLLSKISSVCLKNSLTGFEELSGIPGTVGGAVFMNAGAYGREMKDVVLEVVYLDEQGNIQTKKSQELDFAYRHSIFSDKNCFIYEVKLKLENGNELEIKEKVNEISKRRREKQPLEFPSGGSTFKRPQGYFAAQLIEEAGLKGAKVGGAMVSEKHSGFVINTGDATCSDVLELTKIVKEKVYDKFQVQLELEIKLLR